MKEGQQPLRKKGRGRLIHVSDFINEADGRLIQRNKEGEIIQDARKIIFPGANGDPWWDTEQLLVQVGNALKIFNDTHPEAQALFIFDQSSAHASLPPNALHAFKMNKGNGGAQPFQRDTVIPESNPDPACRGKIQEMTIDLGNGKRQQKGLVAVLQERGFDLSIIRKAKCSPVCPFESQNCCMARVLSQQDDFLHQESMLESMIREASHLCIFLPKFHCELNPIEMVSLIRSLQYWH